MRVGRCGYGWVQVSVSAARPVESEEDGIAGADRPEIRILPKRDPSVKSGCEEWLGVATTGL